MDCNPFGGLGVKLSGLTEWSARYLEKFSSRQLLALACAAGLLATVVIYLFLAGAASEKKQVTNSSMVAVVVAKENIPQRSIIQDSMVKVVQMPADVVPPGAVGSTDEVVGKTALTPIMQGDVLTDQKVLLDDKQAGFVGMIPPDCRAVSVAINDITGIAGFAKAGDYVDVMVVSDSREKNKVTGEILLQNVLLLAINKTSMTGSGNSNANAGDDKSKPVVGGSQEGLKDAPATATLALEPAEALKLIVAAKNGTVYLVLRPFKPRDMFVVDTDYYDWKNGGTGGETPAPAAAQPAAQPVYPAAAPAAAAPAGNSNGGGRSIRVIHGTDVSTVGVK